MEHDFFELPVGDQHRECIEVETDYDRGVMDERKRWESKTCDGCKWYGQKHCTNQNSIAFNSDNAVYEYDGCKEDYEPKGSE